MIAWRVLGMTSSVWARLTGKNKIIKAITAIAQRVIAH
jgi:hypothetical protein